MRSKGSLRRHFYRPRAGARRASHHPSPLLKGGELWGKRAYTFTFAMQFVQAGDYGAGADSPTQKTSLLYHRRGRYAMGKWASLAYGYDKQKTPPPAKRGRGARFGHSLEGSPQVKPLAVTPSMTSARISALVLLTACSRYTMPGQALSTIFCRDCASSGWSSVSQSL